MLSGPQERTFQLCQECFSLRQQGFSFQEIADFHGVHVSTVYRRLQEVADANDVSRDSLLYQPRSPHSHHYTIGRPIKIGRGQELLSELDCIIANADSLLDSLDECLSYEILDLRSVIEHVNKRADG